LLDGTDLKDIHTGDLRSCIGVVSQEPILFDSTIEDNIRYGNPDATIDEIMEAAACANAHEFIMGFPDGYQTQVGPKGGKLSGGQKQRYVHENYHQIYLNLQAFSKTKAFLHFQHKVWPLLGKYDMKNVKILTFPLKNLAKLIIRWYLNPVPYCVTPPF